MLRQRYVVLSAVLTAGGLAPSFVRQVHAAGLYLAHVRTWWVASYCAGQRPLLANCRAIRSNSEKTALLYGPPGRLLYFRI
jgi:hypothetical protein